MKKTKLSEIPWRDYLDCKDYDKSLDRNIIQNRNTLTHREAALAAISKSAMNNRGQMMGREAQILYGS